MAMMPALMIFFGAIAGFVAVCVLEYVLAKLESVWPGLILPVLAALLSLLVPLNMIAPQEGVSTGLILMVVLALIIANIPTFILLLIRYAAREKYRRRKQIDKMNIQDLH